MSKRILIFLFIIKLITCLERQPSAQRVPLLFESRKIRQLDLNLQDVTYSSEKPVNILTPGEKTRPQETATNPDRSYLPPRNIEAAGAQVDETVVQPASEDHHHHPHHHGRDLCSDPFHSFLCEKPKPRKRITGALPSNLQSKYQDIYGNSIIGANSIPAPSRVLAPPDNDLEPRQTTTTYYQTTEPTTLPPTTTEYVSTTYPTTLPTDTTTLPTTTTEIVPAPSNNRLLLIPSANNNLFNYLPPHTGQPSNKIENGYLPPKETAEPTNQVEKEYLPPAEAVQPTNQVENEYLPPKETAQPTNQVEKEYLPPVEAAQPTNENPNTYLPPRLDTAAAQPDVTVVKPEEDHHHKDICSDPFHSFLCAPLKKRVRITGALPNNLVAQNSFLQNRRVYSPKSTVQPIVPAASSNSFRREPPFENILKSSDKVDREYLPPRLVSPTTTTTIRTHTTARKPIILNLPAPSNNIERGYLPPVAPQASNQVRVISSTLPPTTTTRRITTTTTRRPTTTTTPRPTTTTTRRPTTAFRIPFSTIGQPTNNIRSYLPPEAPRFDTAAAENDVTVIKPEQKEKNICSDAFHSFLCTTTKKRTRITGALPNSRLIPANSNINQQRATYPTRPPTTTTTVRPTTRKVFQPAPSNTKNYFTPVSKPKLDKKEESQTRQVEIIYKPAEARDTGYVYNKPDSSLILPNEINQGYQYPRPDVEFPLPSEQKAGYEYPKPEPELPLPSEQNLGYQYPKPDIEFISTTTEKGYDYPKPEKELVLPTNQEEYTYPKPEQELTLPSEQNIGYEYPKPDNEFVLPTDQNGYQYPKPDVEFVLPTEQRKQYVAPSESRQVPIGVQDNSPWIPIIPGSASARTDNRSNYYRKREVPRVQITREPSYRPRRRKIYYRK